MMSFLIVENITRPFQTKNLRKKLLDFWSRFISSAIRSERKDLLIEKQVFEEHFNKEMVEKNLQKKGVFLSSLKKRAYLKKKTDDCKSLFF